MHSEAEAVMTHAFRPCHCLSLFFTSPSGLILPLCHPFTLTFMARANMASLMVPLSAICPLCLECVCRRETKISCSEKQIANMCSGWNAECFFLAIDGCPSLPSQWDASEGPLRASLKPWCTQPNGRTHACIQAYNHMPFSLVRIVTLFFYPSLSLVPFSFLPFSPSIHL